MKKILVKVNNEEELTYPADGYVLGVTRFCICFNKTFNINEINEIIKKNNDKEIYVSLNKPVFNFEVEEYKNGRDVKVILMKPEYYSTLDGAKAIDHLLEEMKK